MRILFLAMENVGFFPDHEVMVANYHDMDRDAIISFRPELVIEKEHNDGKSEYGELLDCLITYFPETPRLLWIWDSYLPHRKLYHSQYQKHFSHLFVAHFADVEHFTRLNPQTYWLPLCFGRIRFLPTELRKEEKYKISFVGTINTSGYEERARILAVLRSRYGSDLNAVTDWRNCYEFLRTSKICFNYSLLNHLTLRPFEGLAMGCEVVSNRMWGMDYIQDLSSKIHVYSTDEEMLYVIDQILENNPVYIHDKSNNLEWVRTRHSVAVRYRQMLEMLKTGRQAKF